MATNVNFIHCDANMVKFGFDRKGQQRYKCMCCGKTKTDSKIKHFDKVAQELVDRMLTEKISIRAMARILGFNYTKYTTVLKYIRKKQ